MSVMLEVSRYRSAVLATHAAHIAWQAGIMTHDDYNSFEILETTARSNMVEAFK